MRHFHAFSIRIPSECLCHAVVNARQTFVKKTNILSSSVRNHRNEPYRASLKNLIQ